MDRRHFLRAGIAAAGGGALLPTAAMVRVVRADGVAPAFFGESPYGPLRSEPDENGLLLPEGFTSRIIARSGELVAGTDYEWPLFPDGAGTFDDGEGGWYYCVNSEVFDFFRAESGGVSSVHFDADGNVLAAYSILQGTDSNCAGGPTPWGTWLSCEENYVHQRGRVFECDPTGEREAVSHPAMGLWSHEAAAVDPEDERVYLTEDNPKGLIYRFTPDAYPDLSAGTLEALIVNLDETISWGVVADPLGLEEKTNEQVPGATVFPGNEGIWYHDGWVYFTAKTDHSVHGLDLRNQTYRLIWRGDPDGLGVEGAGLSHVDNITVDAGSGDLVVAEDGGNMELVIITPEGQLAPLVQVVGPGHEDSEMTGPVFNPTRDRLYFSSQRGPTPRTLGDILPGIGVLDENDAVGGITYEITGPFRGRVQEVVEEPEEPVEEVTADTTVAPTDTEPPPITVAATVPSPVTTLAAVAPGDASADGGGSSDGGGGGAGAGVAIGVGAAVVVAAAGGLLALRSRRAKAVDPDPDVAPAE